jgi:hypothetical protein
MGLFLTLAGWGAHRLFPPSCCSGAPGASTRRPAMGARSTQQRCRAAAPGRVPFGIPGQSVTADSITLGSLVGAVTLWVLPSMQHTLPAALSPLLCFPLHFLPGRFLPTARLRTHPLTCYAPLSHPPLKPQ